MRFIFFSLRDFKVDVGESVRIYGLLNSLAATGNEVVLISNAVRYEMFHPDIKHYYIGCDFQQKRHLQGYLALLSHDFVYKKYNQLFHKIKLALEVVNVGTEPVYFCDYLDNSIGYILKKKGLISKYVNDVHGIATLEFQSHIKNAKSFQSKVINLIKYQLADRLDKKVFEYADGLIYGSYKMRTYYEKRYNLKNTKSYIIPYLLGAESAERKVSDALRVKLLEDFDIKRDDFNILFVGTYKPTAGVEDLITAFDKLFKEFKQIRLILIGSGPYKNFCVSQATALSSRSRILFIDHIPYAELLTYQSLASVLVCPDKDNSYSHYVIHVKYFDALISGRLVINGAFDSVKEINQDDFLSLTFEPSNIDDLYQKLKSCIESFESLTQKYKDAKNFTAENLTYRSYIKQLVR